MIKQILKILLWIVVILAYFNMAFAHYPTIVSDNKYYNHTEVKEFVYSIPEEYYKFVDIIRFIEPGTVYCETNPPSYRCNGNTYAWWNNYRERDCIYAFINMDMLDYDLLVHELGHNYEQCVLKKHYTGKASEDFAWEFRIK